MSDVDEVRNRVQAAISTVLSEAGYMTTKWVLIAETIENESGERGVWLLTAEGALSWDTLGLIRYADQLEAAATVNHHECGDD